MTTKKNSQTGTIWITNGIDNLKIKKDNKIPNEWKHGRTLSKSMLMKLRERNKIMNSDPDIIQKRKETIFKKYGSFSTFTDKDRKKAVEVNKKRLNEKYKNFAFEDLPRARIRNIIFENQNGKCNHCKLDKWLDKEIKLELEHINGDSNDNKRDNLELICPNCHSFTPTWRKKKTKNQYQKYSNDVILETVKSSNSMNEVLKKLNLKWNSSNLIYKLMYENNLTFE